MLDGEDDFGSLLRDREAQLLSAHQGKISRLQGQVRSGLASKARPDVADGGLLLNWQSALHLVICLLL